MRPACHLRTTVLTGLLPCWFFISCRMQKRRWTKCDGSGGVVAATVWDALGGMPALRLFWDAAATLGLADDKAMRYFYFRPMSGPDELRIAWSEAGLKDVEQSSITIRFNYANF